MVALQEKVKRHLNVISQFPFDINISLYGS